MMGLYNAGLGAVLEGRNDEGIALLEEGLELAEKLRYAALRTEAYYGLAEACLAREEFSRATEACEQGLELGITTGETKLEPEFHRLLAEVAFRKGEVHFGDAHHHLRLAIKICDHRRMRFFAGRSLLLLGRLCIRQQKIKQAMKALRRARELFKTTAAQSWLEETDRELVNFG
jgi:tetratricopeptide (TPR) repeat protein